MNEYKEAMDSLRPTDEQRERMFMKAEVMAERESPKKRRAGIKMIAAAVAAMTALIGTTTAFATEIRQFFGSFFEDESLISGEVVENVFHDSDGHVDFYVNRLVSDSMHTYAIVQYTASDDVGRDWLFNWFQPFDYLDTDKKGEVTMNRGDLLLSPNGRVGWLIDGNFELEEAGGDDTRVFKLNIHADDVIAVDDFIKIEYKMSDCGKRSAELHVSETLPLYDRRIDAEYEDGMEAVPKGVKYSALGIMVYGDFIGRSEKADRDARYQLVKSDGTLIGTANCSAASGTDGGGDYDYIIYISYFYEPADVSDVVGIMIGRNYYEFK